MGREILRLLLDQHDMRLVAAVDRPGAPSCGIDAGQLTGGANLGVLVQGDLVAALAMQPQVVIDVSAATAVVGLVEACAAVGCNVLVCTTGLDAAAERAIELASERIAVLQAANTSLGVNLLLDLVRRTTAVLGTADIEIVEMHHRHKRDAPSGTALALARAAANARGLDLAQAARHGRHGQEPHDRPIGEIGIHALRGGDVVGDHQVVFALEGERIELIHRASSRATFARGALVAARFLASSAPGRYRMADALGLAP
jgi:4-hydroxy-tetrahydrodipicolinate reductase